MKYMFITTLLMVTPFFLFAQLKLNNNGAILKVNNNTNLRVNNGSIDNKNTGSISNNGNIYLDANFTQTTGATYTGSTTSWLWFEGATNQNANGDAPLDIAKLRVDNGNRLILGNHINIGNQVDLTNNGHIELGIFNLVINSGATITGYDAANYIITNNTGYLQQEVGVGAVFFPAGNSTYNPATISNSGTIDNFQLRVEDQVLDFGTSGTPENSGIVNRTWHIEEMVVGGSIADIMLQWNTAEELVFDRTNCAVSHWDGAAWDHSMVYTNATNIGLDTWTQTRTGQNSFSPFVVEDLNTQLPIELLYFNAQRQDIDNVRLDWATSLEINNQGFEIQRMLDNETEFKTIAWVDGVGNTTLQQNYEQKDANSYPAISYYRLKQVDFDGTFTYSPTRAVEGQRSASDIILMPNPTSDIINIRFGAFNANSARVVIYAADGKIVMNRAFSITAHQVLTLEETKDFPAGTYFLQAMLNDGTNYTAKFVKLI